MQLSRFVAVSSPSECLIHAHEKCFHWRQSPSFDARRRIECRMKSLSKKKTTSKRKSANLVKKVKHVTVTSILRQYQKSDSPHTGNYGTPLSVNNGQLGHVSNGTTNANWPRRLKLKFPCRRCQKYGHWNDDHNVDGSLKTGVASYDKPWEFKNGNARKNGKQQTVSTEWLVGQAESGNGFHV